MNETVRQGFWVAGGVFAVGLGMLGAVLPILPTTPFLLLAAFCFARGSERLSNWLLAHPRLGPAISGWRAHRAIPAKAKRIAMLSMAAALSVSLLAGVPVAILGAQALVMAGAAAFILTRPSPPS